MNNLPPKSKHLIQIATNKEAEQSTTNGTVTDLETLNNIVRKTLLFIFPDALSQNLLYKYIPTDEPPSLGDGAIPGERDPLIDCEYPMRLLECPWCEEQKLTPKDYLRHLEVCKNQPTETVKCTVCNSEVCCKPVL
jgi:hypothetical protein